MSTFHGHVREFPSIRIDNFRQTNGIRSRPPLAVFLSHVHTDHTVGLDSFKSCFIYCSPATKEILLKLEKYPHRMNFAQGILESRVQHFRHLKKLLKAIPLETPTEIELGPSNTIRVTLFDANHCIGAVMFLIEGDGKAIVYTGDIRSEGWWVNSLTRNPLLIPYAACFNGNPVKRLDRIYLDTTFVATGLQPHHKDFQSKAEGLAELVQKVSAYPPDTVFYFDAWTFGYEDVWQTLASFLRTSIHLDVYRLRLYTSLAHASGTQSPAPEVPRMLGYNLGNHFKAGFVTARQTRLHSCEEGAGCEVFNKSFVRITPIVSRFEGGELVEAGAGGGRGDLDQRHELDTGDEQLMSQLITFCMAKLHQQPEMLRKVVQFLLTIVKQREQAIALDPTALIERPTASQEEEVLGSLDELPLDRLIPALTKLIGKPAEPDPPERPAPPKSTRTDGLPDRITFPYSRHSSYSELCLLIDAFKPLDIFPCTVVPEDWTFNFSMQTLFGHLYEDKVEFSHDKGMVTHHGTAQQNRASPASHRTTQEPSSSQAASQRSNHKRLLSLDTEQADGPPANPRPFDRTENGFGKGKQPQSCGNTTRPAPSSSAASSRDTISPRRRGVLELRQEAFDMAVRGEWSGMRLSSTSNYELEEEL